MPKPIMQQDPANLRRAQRFANSLHYYKRAELADSGPIGKEDLTDLLADIRHYCDREGYSYWDLEKTAQHNYTAEVVNPKVREQR